jgi:hypothetical protein
LGRAPELDLHLAPVSSFYSQIRSFNVKIRIVFVKESRRERNSEANGSQAAIHHLQEVFSLRGRMEMNLTASSFPAACRGVNERIQMSYSLQIEDSPQLAAGSFNGPSEVIRLLPGIFHPPPARRSNKVFDKSF